MKNRLISKIRKSGKSKDKMFCAFLTLGYPNLKTTAKLIQGFEDSGVDIVELGFPFSDPMADGPTIQFSSQKALDKGVSVKDAFKMVKDLRKQGVQMPIIFFSYVNPIMAYGFKKFSRDAKGAGFDGVIVPDLPPKTEKGFDQACRKHGLSQVYLIAPTTGTKRAGNIVHQSNGFVYYVSLRGVTGVRRSVPQDIKTHISRIRTKTSKPFLIGFGVSTPKQAKVMSRMSDGVIVGSAIMDRLKKSGGKAKPVLRYVKQMVRSTRSSKNAGSARA